MYAKSMAHVRTQNLILCSVKASLVRTQRQGFFLTGEVLTEEARYAVRGPITDPCGTPRTHKFSMLFFSFSPRDEEICNASRRCRNLVVCCRAVPLAGGG